MKVLITDNINKCVKDIISETAEAVFLPTMSEEEIIKIIGEYDALMVRSQTKVNRNIIEAGKKLKIIGRAGVGVDNIDVNSATEKGIIVVNSPDGNTIAASEHTIALMLAISRNIVPASQSTKEGKWNRDSFTGTELFGKTLGVMGFGRIGRLVFRLMDSDPEFEIVAINDLTDAEQLAYLLKYDTNHRNYRVDEISFEGDKLVVGDKRIPVFAEKDPAFLPWKALEMPALLLLLSLPERQFFCLALLKPKGLPD